MRNLARLHRVPFIGYWATYSAIVGAMWGDWGHRGGMPQWVFATAPYRHVHLRHESLADVAMRRHA